MTTISNSVIQRALKDGNPVIETDQAVFIWEGKSAPHLVGDFNHWGDKRWGSNFMRFKRVSPKQMPDSTEPIWSLALTLPRDAYIEYAFYDPVSQSNFLDPLNKKSVNNGAGGRNNFFYMPETMPSPFPMRRADVKPGTLSKHRVESGLLRDDYERNIYLYRPPVKEPVPLLIVYDGQDYLDRGKLAVIVDNLIDQKRIAPIAMAFLPHGGRWRNVEYACSDATLHWVEQIILPLAHEKLNLLDIKKQQGTYGVLGASAGGLMSMYTGLRMPDIFGKVLSQSGVSALDGRDFATVDLVRHRHANQIEIWMDVGKLEFLLEDNRRMSALLADNGYHVHYREYAGGHNYTSWRNDVWRGLEEMFPV
ncbi:MAG TPA: alpha/beta hydrolase-fold protein [Anaerolineales bacterium]|nr:alpha/beta hydrolase-fold protein [Anaerolineales bacterium]